MGRNVPIYPLSSQQQEQKDDNETLEICVPIEAKGIQGSDKRKYILDLTRLTPRDANWVSIDYGGTGNWEKENLNDSNIPNDLNDDEWTMAVLRPELISFLIEKGRKELLAEKKKKNKNKEISRDNNNNAEKKKKEVVDEN